MSSLPILRKEGECVAHQFTTHAILCCTTRTRTERYVQKEGRHYTNGGGVIKGGRREENIPLETLS